MFQLQLLGQPFAIRKKEEKINTKILKCNPQNVNGILSYTPLQKVKFTVKAGINDSAIDKDLKDSFNDVESTDVLSVIKYDTRAKIYLNKKWRFLMRAQLLGAKNNIYTFGFFVKI